MFNLLKISEGVKEIAKQMIENPHDWVQGNYYYQNKSNLDIAIWTTNGVFFLNIRGFDGLSLAEKYYLSNAIKKSIARKLTTAKPQ